jgi:2'-5' RNA ligase
MRLFVAVDLDDHTRARVGRVIETLRSEMERARSPARISWTAPDRLHLTLQFIGEVSDAVSHEISARLRPAFARPSFEMHFDRLGTFPRSGRPRVVWLGIERGADALGALQTEVADRLSDVAFRRESRAFSPHLTLARFKDGGTRADGERIAGVPLAPAAGCTIDHVTLYHSRLSPRGATYTPLVVTPLGPAEISA